MVEFTTENIDVNSEYANFINQKKTESKDTVRIPKFTNETTFDEFLEYMKTEKEYLSYWAGTTIEKINSNCQVGYDVKIGGSVREKRIEVVIIFENKPIICRTVKSYKDAQSRLVYLTDVNKLIRKAGFDLAAIAIILTESNGSISDTARIEKLRQKYEFTLIPLKRLWDALNDHLVGNSTDSQRILFD